MNVNAEQPAPSNASGPPVWPIVFAQEDVPGWLAQDMRERDMVGTQRYGEPLRVWNGRNAAVDAYQEALDLCAYTKQAYLRVHGVDDYAAGALLMIHKQAVMLAEAMGRIVRDNGVPTTPRVR